MSLWKRTMDYLGLGPDDAYDEYDDYDEPEPAPRPRRANHEPEPRSSRAPQHETEGEGIVRTAPARPTFPSRDFDASQARRSAASDDSGVNPRPSRGSSGSASNGGVSLRAVPSPSSSTEPYTVRPRRFDSAQEVADKFKEGQPVIMNLEASDREVARRLIDFASGICYALDGSMEKVATGVYLLKPPAVRVAHYDDDIVDDDG
ncbi:MAG: cell division protein SepF [Ilumatobacteraceae bacterium]